MSDRPIVVVGATGFVGAALVRHFLKMERPVLSVGRRPAQATPAPYLEIPAFEHTPLVDAFKGASLVINCIGKTGNETAEPQASAHNANASLPVALYQAACAAGVGQFVHISSVAAIGSTSTPGRLARDDDLPQPSNSYGKTKLIGDEALKAAQASTKLLILRPPILYDAGVSGIFGLLMRCARLGLPLPFANLHNVRNFMFIGNLADAILTASDRGTGGTFLVTGGPAIRIDDLYSALCRTAGHSRRSYPLPTPFMRLLARTILRSRAESLLADAAYDDHPFRIAANWSPKFDLMQSLAFTMHPTFSMETDT